MCGIRRGMEKAMIAGELRLPASFSFPSLQFLFFIFFQPLSC